MQEPKTTEFTADGLGTRWYFEIFTPNVPISFQNEIQSRITQFDDAYSRFKPFSYIGRLNNSFVLTNPPQELLDMFAFAEKMYVATEGAFNISVGAALQNLGYGKKLKNRTVYTDFWNETRYTTDEIRIPHGASVDLGGFGKGWLLDQLAVFLEHSGFPDYVINGGGDIVVSAKKPLEFALEHPYETGKMIGTTKIKQGGLGVSSNVKRQWVKDGKSYHHIIDPGTTLPSNSTIISAYVKAPTALISDTLATILLIRPELAPKLKELFGCQVILLDKAVIAPVS